MPSASIRTDIREFGNPEAALARMDVTLRGISLMLALRKSAQPVVRMAKALCPKGGPRIKTKTGKKHLRDTITSAVRDYGETKVLVIGPAYPAGAHAHLVEFGHDVVRGPRGGTQAVVGRAAPHPFMRPAVEQAKPEQIAVFTRELQKLAAEATA